MFDLVNNIEHYPLFLPWCAKSLVHTRSNSQIEATLYIAKGPIKKSFTTINHLLPHQGIEMRLKDGPFRHLKLAFEFSNPLLAMTFGPIFQHIANTFVQSFYTRAHQVYVAA
jgi:ribosome-associated toxin RatA of RatAB toxin-antitoxin module